MPPDLVLSIDLGSSWCKAAYMDREGSIVSEGRVFSRPITDDGDIRLERFWEVVSGAVRLASANLAHRPVPDAIGVSCRGLFGICLDQKGQAFIPSYDLLSSKSSPEVETAFRAPVWGGVGPYEYGYAVRLAGLVAELRRSSPDEWNEIHRVGALHDYLIYKLCDRWVTDPTTGPSGHEWPEGLIELSGLPLHAFPVIQDPWAIVGHLTSEAAAALQLPPGIRVVTGLHDGAAANMGTGTIYPGDTCLTLGTNFAVRVVTGKRPVSDCFGYIVAPGQWAWVNSVPRVATQLDLVALALIETPADLRAKHFLLEELAAAVSPDSRLPCLSLGNHAALLDTVTDARHRGFSTGQTYLAMLHAVAVEIRHLVDSALSDGARATRFVATGGGVKNTQLLRVLSTTLGLPVEIGHPEAGLLGGGIVAAIGAGWYPGLRDAWRVMARPNAIVHPDPGMSMRTTGEVRA